MPGKPAFTTLYPMASGPIGAESFQWVSAEWVAEHAADPDVRIVDVREVHAYLAGHVPNAVHIPEAAVQSSCGGLPASYIGPAATAALFGRAGIGDDTRVVLYSAGENVLGATVVAYSLLRIGHRHVMVMDGGFDDYAQRHPLTQAYPSAVEAGHLTPTLEPTLFIDHRDVRAALGSPGVVLLDARPAHHYLGNSHQWMRNGHIPGAISFDWHQLTHAGATTALRNAHRVMPLDEMHALVDATGIAATDDIIVYCGTSREASLLFVLVKFVLGYPRVRLYEGSMTEWSSLADYPVETAGRVVQPTPLSATVSDRSAA